MGSQLSLTAVEVYLDLLSARDRLALQLANLQTHQDVLTQIEERRRLGAGGVSDLLTIQSRLADTETLAINAEADLLRAEARYEQIFAAEPPASLLAVPQAPELDADLARAVNNSPRLKSIDSQILEGQASVKQARASRLPRVELSGTALTDYEGDADFVVNLGVTYQFDTQDQIRSSVDGAQANLQRLRSEKARIARDINRALDFLQADCIAGTKRLNAARAAVEANRQNIEAATEEFSIGRSTLLEMLDAQRDFVAAEIVLVRAERAQILTGYETLALTGDIITTFAITLPQPKVGQRPILCPPIKARHCPRSKHV